MREKDMIRPKVLITRKIFDETIAIIKKHFDMEDNQRDVAFSPKELIRRLQGKAGAIILLTDRIDEAVLSQCPDLRIVSNIAVGYNNIDVPACTRHTVMVTNTPGVLDDTTADFTWTLLLATARRLVEADQHLRSSRWNGWKLMEFLGSDVHHKTLGICGLGRLDREWQSEPKGSRCRYCTPI